MAHTKRQNCDTIISMNSVKKIIIIASIFVVIVIILGFSLIGYKKQLPFLAVIPFNSGFAGVNVNNKWGVINTKGEYVVKPSFDYLKAYNKGFIVLENYKYGYLDYSGKSVIPTIYSRFEPFENALKVFKGENVGLLNLNGEVIIEPEYTNIEPDRDFYLVFMGQKVDSAR